MSSIFDYAIEGYETNLSSKKIGIFGNPIKHTLSPIIHDTLSENLGIDEKYIPFLIEKDLKKCVDMAFDEGILGLNITVPHKQNVIQALVEVDDAAKAIGAVNTLVRISNGYKGYNTDMPGLARAMFSENIAIDNKNVIIIGAGGAARAVAYMCNYYNANQIYIINRTYDNAKKIVDDMNFAFDTNRNMPISSDNYSAIPKDKYLFIQCTSIGLHEKDGLPLIIGDSFYDMAEAAVDLIYNPAETPFLKLMKDKNIPYMNGLKMLLYQGIMAYELWNDINVSDELGEMVYKTLYKAVYNNSNNIVLVGYMGSGKSTIGKYIAKEFGYNFIDTDEYIELKQKMTINDIFATYGEEYFRNLETEVLRELNGKSVKTVISTGGGMPVKKENQEILRDIGKVIYLAAKSETIYDRVKNSTNRPLLACKNPRKKIEEMIKTRNPIYSSVADYIIETDEQNIKDIASKIIALSC